jgi:hypothetical protein
MRERNREKRRQREKMRKDLQVSFKEEAEEGIELSLSTK